MLNVTEIQKLVPQRYPFLMIDKIVEIKEGEFIKACKNVSIGEECFNGHFPGNAIFPGALIAEAMAQAACVLIKKSIPDLGASLFFVTSVKIRFFRVVVPGDSIAIKVRAIKMTRIGGIFETEASVSDQLVSKGEMTFACK